MSQGPASLVRTVDDEFIIDASLLVPGMTGTLQVEAESISTGMIRTTDMWINGVPYERGIARIVLSANGWVIASGTRRFGLVREDYQSSTASAKDKWAKACAAVIDLADASQEFTDSALEATMELSRMAVPQLQDEVDALRAILKGLNQDIAQCVDTLSVSGTLTIEQTRMVVALLEAGHKFSDAVSAARKLT